MGAEWRLAEVEEGRSGASAAADPAPAGGAGGSFLHATTPAERASAPSQSEAALRQVAGKPPCVPRRSEAPSKAQSMATVTTWVAKRP